MSKQSSFDHSHFKTSFTTNKEMLELCGDADWQAWSLSGVVSSSKGGSVVATPPCSHDNGRTVLRLLNSKTKQVTMPGISSVDLKSAWNLKPSIAAGCEGGKEFGRAKNGPRGLLYLKSSSSNALTQDRALRGNYQQVAGCK